MRGWEHRPGAAYLFEFTQTLPRDSTRRVKAIESLGRIERRVEDGNAATYFVQIVNEPYQILALKGWYALLILLAVKYVGELVVKGGRGSVGDIELL